MLSPRARPRCSAVETLTSMDAELCWIVFERSSVVRSPIRFIFWRQRESETSSISTSRRTYHARQRFRPIIHLFNQRISGLNEKNSLADLWSSQDSIYFFEYSEEFLVGFELKRKQSNQTLRLPNSITETFVFSHSFRLLKAFVVLNFDVEFIHIHLSLKLQVTSIARKLKEYDQRSTPSPSSSSPSLYLFKQLCIGHQWHEWM